MDGWIVDGWFITLALLHILYQIYAVHSASIMCVQCEEHTLFPELLVFGWESQLIKKNPLQTKFRTKVVFVIIQSQLSRLCMHRLKFKSNLKIHQK
jgi:hypothetical protein